MTEDDLRAEGARDEIGGASVGVSAALDLRSMMIELLGDTSKSLSNFFLRFVGVLVFGAVKNEDGLVAEGGCCG